MKKALIFSGGWEGHEPEEVSEILKGLLEEKEVQVEVSTTLNVLEDVNKLRGFDLIVPNWTQGQITQEQLQPLLQVVQEGVGLAGLHGGMGDSFRMETDYQFMVGGQWVSHPGNDGVRYTVNIVEQEKEHPLVAGMDDFEVESEQYFMHVDPSVKVLATTRFPIADGPHVANGQVDMPVVWTKYFGKGNVYYCSLGHVANIVRMPEVLELMQRGMLWAAR